MLEPSLTSQLLGAGSIAVSFFVAGMFISWIECRKKMREAKEGTLKAFEEGLPEHNAQVIEDYEDFLAEQRKTINLYTDSPEIPFHVF